MTIILAVVSYITKIKKSLKTWLQKIKQKIYQLLLQIFNPFPTFAITNYNTNHFSETKEQGEVVSSAIHILKNNLQNTILISGYAGRGKTTSIMLLLNAIANDKELYQLFSQLHNRIVYFDSVNDKSELLKYLQYSEKHGYKLIIIDNIQKYTISTINEIMDKIENLSIYNRNITQKILIVLLYQETNRNNALYMYIKNNFFQDGKNVFELKKCININTNKHRKIFSLEDEKLKNSIDQIEDEFFKQHIKYILNNRKNSSIINFLNDTIFAQPDSISTNNQKKVFLLMAFIMMGTFNGYVSKKNYISFGKRIIHFYQFHKWIL